MMNESTPQNTIASQIENMSLPQAEDIKDNIANAYTNFSDNISTIKNNVTDSLNQFSSKHAVDAGSEFLQSNSIIAKFAFLILVIIVFVMLINLGIRMIGYFSEPANSPYLVKGTVPGASGIVVTQDPKLYESVVIQRSNNQSSGAEFTWSAWIFITSLAPRNISTSQEYQHIFNKGDATYDNIGISINNGPGMYLNNKTNKIRVYMDTSIMDNTTSVDKNSGKNYIDVDNIPLQKWVNVIVRLQNTILDVYVNGSISKRLVLTNAPIQNYYDVNIGKNGGFNGNLANLRYFNYALNVFDINSLVLAGPNTTASNSFLNIKSITDPTFSYLSSMWYSKNINNST
jgi:hypothetical protein